MLGIYNPTTEIFRNVEYQINANYLEFSDLPRLQNETHRTGRGGTLPHIESIYGVLGDVMPGQKAEIAIPCAKILTVPLSEKLPLPSIMGVIIMNGKRCPAEISFEYDR